MLELVLIVCLISGPGDSCREERPGFEGLTTVSCMTQGQMLAARWMSERPALTLRRWRCETAGGRNT
ncbi:MAG TPA: hypothetical protein VE033_19750 [Acetobacteraceae bacterium]|jgi:hypothetical protein|nr:hypothetical protein [Acetobacteraceae bacterium]